MPALLFAHGAGQPSSSRWMTGWTTRLAAFGPVRTFDYPYMRRGSKRPDRHDALLACHREELARLRVDLPTLRVVLVGKSMGSRIGCHLALETNVSAIVALGFPLMGAKGQSREEVLLALHTPILFVQGTRDPLCPLDRLAAVRARMHAPNELHVVDSGDHSLAVTAAWRKTTGRTQADADDAVVAAIGAFLHSHS